MRGPLRDIGAWQSRQSLLAGLRELGVVVGAVDVMAGEASYAAAIHHALDEVVALHAVFVGGAVGKVREGGLT